MASISTIRWVVAGGCDRVRLAIRDLGSAVVAKLLQLGRDLLANKPGAESELADHGAAFAGETIAHERRRGNFIRKFLESDFDLLVSNTTGLIKLSHQGKLVAELFFGYRDTGGNNFAPNDEMRLAGQDKWEALNIGELAKHAAKEVDK